MIPLSLWLLSCLGLTWVLTRSAIFAWLRALFPKPHGEAPFFGILVRCPQCMGFWVGIVHEIAAPVFSPPGGLLHRIVSALLGGFAASGLGYFMNLVCEKLGQRPLDE